jgi:hypothetical protein
MMRLSQSGSSGCGSGSASSMAGDAVDFAADTDASLFPAAPGAGVADPFASQESSVVRPGARAAHARNLTLSTSPA